MQEGFSLSSRAGAARVQTGAVLWRRILSLKGSEDEEVEAEGGSEESARKDRAGRKGCGHGADGRTGVANGSGATRSGAAFGCIALF